MSDNEELNTHHEIVPFGKHKGERWTRVPIDYLIWIAAQEGMNQEWRDMAASERKRRGHVEFDEPIRISKHAVDNASLRCMDVYLYDRKPQEGIYTWLLRITQEAMAKPALDAERGLWTYKGMSLVITKAEVATLKTIMKLSQHGGDRPHTIR